MMISVFAVIACLAVIFMAVMTSEDRKEACKPRVEKTRRVEIDLTVTVPASMSPDDVAKYVMQYLANSEVKPYSVVTSEMCNNWISISKHSSMEAGASFELDEERDG